VIVLAVMPISSQAEVSGIRPLNCVEVPKTLEAVKAVDAPAITASAKLPSSGNIEDIVRRAARNHGVNEDYFVRIARCESGLNPDSVNYNYYENGYPSGLFQHLSGYWPARAAKYGYAGASVFNPVANANVTAAMFHDGYQSLWECK